MAGDVYAHPPHAGRGGWSWYTGSAGWMYRAGLESILGLRRRGATFAIDPCIPSSWPELRDRLAVRRDAATRSRSSNPERRCRGVATADARRRAGRRRGDPARRRRRRARAADRAGRARHDGGERLKARAAGSSAAEIRGPARFVHVGRRMRRIALRRAQCERRPLRFFLGLKDSDLNTANDNHLFRRRFGRAIRPSSSDEMTIVMIGFRHRPSFKCAFRATGPLLFD